MSVHYWRTNIEKWLSPYPKRLILLHYYHVNLRMVIFVVLIVSSLILVGEPIGAHSLRPKLRGIETCTPWWLSKSAGRNPQYHRHVAVASLSVSIELGRRDGDVFRLTSYELASELSYLFWQTMPDEEPLRGPLMEHCLVDTLAAQAERLIEDLEPSNAG